MASSPTNMLGEDGYRGANSVELETVERCRSCKKGFKSRWGDILTCKDHEYLDEASIPPQTLKLPPRTGARHLAGWAAAFKHHGYKCSECGSTERLVVHHVKIYEQCEGVDEFFGVENSQVLCKPCHSSKHPELSSIRKESAAKIKGAYGRVKR